MLLAALRVSHGDTSRLRKAILLGDLDFRDLLTAAGFAWSTSAHKKWKPKSGPGSWWARRRERSSGLESPQIEAGASHIQVTDWTGFTWDFESLTRRHFQFLVETRHFDEPSIEYQRDFYVVYKGLVEGLEIRVGMERDYFLPLIHCRVSRDSGVATVSIRQACNALNIAIEEDRCPMIVELAELAQEGHWKEGWLPNDGELGTTEEFMSFHSEHREEVVGEVPHYLGSCARVLDREYERIIKQAASAE